MAGLPASEAAERADFSQIRYAQVWEDADVLLEALEIEPDDVCLSIASAGDNCFSLLSRGPARVIAVDLSEAQLACVKLRLAAYQCLDHTGLLELIGSRPSQRRLDLYRDCQPMLDADARAFWDARQRLVEQGIGSVGKFERYFAIFRNFILPLVHSKKTVHRLLRGGPDSERAAFYKTVWDTWRWRALFRIFFSRRVMGALGRDPEFFRYVEGTVSDRIFARTQHALTFLDPAANPYLQWILTGRHLTALPHALRKENFAPIRSHLDRLELRRESMESFAATYQGAPLSKLNLSDIFEYVSPGTYAEILGRLADKCRSGARLAYWNMLAPRSRPESLANRLRPLAELAHRLHQLDKAFFYSAFIVEEIL